MKRDLVRSAVLGGLLRPARGSRRHGGSGWARRIREVKIDNFTFVPQRVTVKPGTTVTWVNDDDIPHAIAATGKEFRSKVLDTNDKYSFTFTTAGTFEYFCSLHPHMTGTIVVEPAPEGGAAP